MTENNYNKRKFRFENVMVIKYFTRKVKIIRFFSFFIIYLYKISNMKNNITLKILVYYIYMIILQEKFYYNIYENQHLILIISYNNFPASMFSSSFTINIL